MTDSELTKRVDAMWEYREWSRGQNRYLKPGQKDAQWSDIKDKHGVSPLPPAKAEPPMLRFGAEIVDTKHDTHPFEARTPTHWLTMDGEWNERRGYAEGVGQHRTYDLCLAALNAAPPPPGWVEPQANHPKTLDSSANGQLLAEKPAPGGGSAREYREQNFPFGGWSDPAVDAFAARAKAELVRERDALRAENERLSREWTAAKADRDDFLRRKRVAQAVTRKALDSVKNNPTPRRKPRAGKGGKGGKR